MMGYRQGFRGVKEGAKCYIIIHQIVFFQKPRDSAPVNSMLGVREWFPEDRGSASLA